MILRTLKAPLLALTMLLPALVALSPMLSPSESEARGRRQSERQRVLAAIPDDPTVLINVKYGDMPGSPDILRFGKQSTKALERCLADNIDANNRVLCAVTLQALGDRRALPTLQTAVEDWDASVRHRVVLALGAMPDKGSVEPLLALYRRGDEETHVRRAVLRAFQTISDQRVLKALRADLNRKPKEKSVDLRPELFRAVWANRHLMARGTLAADVRQALRSDNDSVVLAATLASSELRSPRLVDALIPLMEHSWPEIRNKAVYALGRIGDKKAAKALLKRLPRVRESRMLNNLAFALERLDKAAFYKAIKGVAEHKQAVIRLNAAFVLGDVRHAEGLPLLETALKDASDYVRTSAVVAVGKLGTTEEGERQRAIAALEPFVQHPNLSLRQEAIYALHALTEGGRADLIHDKLYKLDRAKFRGASDRAALVLAKAGDVRVKDHILRCLLHGPCWGATVHKYVKDNADDVVAGRLLLAWARGDHDVTQLVADLNPAGTIHIARSALQDAWSAPLSGTTTHSLRLLGSLGNKEPLAIVKVRSNSIYAWTRIRASVAAVRLGDQAGATKLAKNLTNLPAESLPGFVSACALIERPASRQLLKPALEAHLKSEDIQVALAAAAVLLEWDPDTGIFRFLEALGSAETLERNLAERYLKRSDNQKVTWVLRRALAREGRPSTKDRLRALLDHREA